MKLYLTTTSPYGWVVRIILAETGLSPRVQVCVVPTRVPDSPINTLNPTGKIPTLETEGVYLSETRLICQYLDGLHGGLPTVAQNPALQARAFEGLVTGFTDGVAVWLRELRRAPQQRSPGILEQERRRVERCLDYLEADTHWREDRADYPRTVLAVTLAIIDERIAVPMWAQTRPRLASWYHRFRQRPSMHGTRVIAGQQ